MKLLTIAALSLLSLSAFPGECYKSVNNSNLEVCFAGDITLGAGEGVSILSNKKVGQNFTWFSGTSGGSLLIELDVIGEETGCESELKIIGNTLTIKNIAGECGILSGKYKL